MAGAVMHSALRFVEFKKDEIEQSVPDRFEQQVAKCPDRIAVKSRSRILTYEQLNRAANRAARAILAGCGQKEEAVAVFLEHDTDLVVAMLAILKAGKIFAPLDVAYPPTRIKYVLEDTLAGGHCSKVSGSFYNTRGSQRARETELHYEKRMRAHRQ